MTLYVKNPDDEDVTSWRAVMTSNPVAHDYPSITDNGQTHGSTCRLCGFTSHESHDFVNHCCLVCGHIAEATLIEDDNYTDYTYFDDAFEASQYKTSTLIVNRDFESSNNHWVECEDTDLTLDLNGHTISLWYTPHLTKGKLTIKDDTGMGKIHAIMNKSNALYVNNSQGDDPTLIIKGGQLIGDEGEDNDHNHYKAAGLFVDGGVASSASGSGSHISLEGGTYSGIAANAAFNAMNLLATDCFYVDATTGETKSNIKKESSLWNTTSIDNVRVYNPAQKITTGSTLNVSDQTTPETELNELLSRVTDNLLVNTFMNTDLETAVDIRDNTIASALQQAAIKAGKVLNVTTATHIKAYIKAELKAVTIENVTVGENTVKVLSKLTFDVKPYAETTLADGTRIAAVIGNSLIGSDVTFRLPVDPQLNAEKLGIYRKSDEQLAEPVLLARLNVQQQNIGTEAAPNILKFVDVQTSSFSEFSYQMETTFTLVDGTAYSGAEEKTFTELSYTRDFTKADVNAWQTWFVPMNYQVGSTADYDFAKIVKMGYLDSNGQIADDLSGSESLVLVVTKYAEGDIVPGGVPALVRKNVSGHDEATFASCDGKLLSATDVQQLSASTTTDNYTFTGTYQTCTPSLYWYTLSVGGRLTRITKETTTLKPYRWYHKRVSKSGNGGGSSAPIRIITIGEDNGTLDIQSIIANQPQVTSSYDLQGRRVDQMGRGLYLYNGKKVYNQ